MKGLNGKVYEYFWGRDRDEAARRDLNEGIAVNMGWLVGLSIIGFCVIVVADRFGAQWAGEAWLAQLVFVLIIVLPLLNPQTRRSLFVRRKLRAEDYPAHMAKVRKRVLVSGVFFAAMMALLMSDVWQSGWVIGLCKLLIIGMIFAGLSYLHERIEARRAVARAEEGKEE
ncbi:MAG: hypothetical protein Q4D61_02670 [Cardiobacteriaceae bacterium]|nr:hypothetical protein [Cardiobacteriaceae bacterium]